MKHLSRLKRRAYALVETVSYEDLSRQKYDLYDVFMLFFIFLNVASVILETVQSLHSRYLHIFRDFEIFSVVVFTVDYILRVWTCTLNPKYEAPFWGRIKFVLSFMALVDLFSFLPFYLPMFIPFSKGGWRGIISFHVIAGDQRERSDHTAFFHPWPREGPLYLLIPLFSPLFRPSPQLL